MQLGSERCIDAGISSLVPESPAPSGLMPTRYRVPGPAQISAKTLLHLHRRLQRHRIHVRVKLRQQVDAVALDQRTTGNRADEVRLRDEAPQPELGRLAFRRSRVVRLAHPQLQTD